MGSDEEDQDVNSSINDDSRLQGINKLVYSNGLTDKKKFNKLRDYINSITGSNIGGNDADE